MAFQLTRPRGARQRHHRRHHHRQRVSTHAPARGATNVPKKIGAWCLFQLTRPRGARQTLLVSDVQRFLFQLTRPRGARPNSASRSVSLSRFNSRAREGRDARAISIWYNVCMFQLTRPRGARLTVSRFSVLRVLVSTHAPARGATSSSLRHLTSATGFNSRAREGRDFSSEMGSHGYWFQLTRPRGARHIQDRNKAPMSCFNSRAREGRDATAATGVGTGPRFNSRAREGRDFQPQGTITLAAVSTHAPARGATCCSAFSARFLEFQLTRPRGARQEVRTCCTDSPSFQLTRPRGARLGGVIDKVDNETFQLTRPRGARPRSWTTSKSRTRFNSRAREGRDAHNLSSLLIRISFNSRAREGRDLKSSNSNDLCAFQLTRPRGARRP
mgnify:CR=1 FL=1